MVGCVDERAVTTARTDATAGAHEAARVLSRLERIEALDRSHALPELLLDELRALLAEAEAWVRVEGRPSSEARDALERCRLALAEPVKMHEERGRTLLA